MNEAILLKAAQWIASNRDCVLALIDADGYPTAATITPSKSEGIQRLYISNSIHSNWAQRIALCNRASICYSSAQPECNITLVGNIELMTDDPALKAEMWRDWMAEYYSGPQDPNFCVFQFTTRRYSIFLDGTQVRGAL